MKELEFLRDSNVITDSFYNQIVEKLPSRYQAGAPPIDFIGSTGAPSHSNSSAPTPNEKNNVLASRPNIELVEALYDYKPQQPEDLELRTGDKIQVLEHTSPDWWKGSIGSRSGMFPSNYIKPLDDQRQAPSPAPSYQSAMQPQHSNQSQNQHPSYMYQGNPQQFASPPPPSTQVQFPPYQGSPYPPQQQAVPYQAPPQQQPVVQQPQVAQHGGHGAHGEQFKRFGSKLGNAAIFGAGATIGSDLVNSIF